MATSSISGQVVGAIVEDTNNRRIAQEVLNLLRQDENFAKAIQQVNAVRDFVGSPESILGSIDTKHGEIAEHVEVGISNARSLIEGGEKVATFENVGRTSQADYLFNNLEVQSKFHNGINNTLGKGILGHLEKYPNFTNDGAFYHIPKDQFEVIQKVINGESVDGLSQSTINAIQKNVAEIESRTGLDFFDVVKPSVSDYSEVQQGAINNTLDSHENDLAARNEEIKDDIHDAHKANFIDGFKVTLSAAALAGGFTLTLGLYRHYKNGKNVFKGHLTEEDWRQLGVDTTKAAALGGVSAASIYFLTNYLEVSSPFAAAIVSASKGVLSLNADYLEGKISLSEFTNDGLLICSESAIVGLATFAGQTLIPVPMLGAVIGALAGHVFTSVLSDKSEVTVGMLKKQMNDFLSELDESTRETIDKLTSEFKMLGDLTSVAFDTKLNSSLLTRSIQLAHAHCVPDEKILKSVAEIDNYFLN